MATGRIDCQTSVVSWKSTGASKSNLSDTSLTPLPISETQKVELSLSFRLEAECVSFGKHVAHSEARRRQNSSLCMHVELACIVRPRAKLPVGGKQPSLLVHVCCCADAALIRNVHETAKTNIESMLK